MKDVGEDVQDFFQGGKERVYSYIYTMTKPYMTKALYIGFLIQMF